MEEALEEFRRHCSNSTVCLEVKKSPTEGIGGADRRKLAAALAGQVGFSERHLLSPYIYIEIVVDSEKNRV